MSGQTLYCLFLFSIKSAVHRAVMSGQTLEFFVEVNHIFLTNKRSTQSGNARSNTLLFCPL